MTDTHAGGCLCGAVRYEVSGDFQGFFLCHCGRCRKGTGSAHAANLFARGATLRWLCGAAQVATFRLSDTRHMRSFCRICGSPLPTQQENAAMVVVPAGSLDSELLLTPQGHIFMARRAGWDKDFDEVPCFDGLP